MNNIAGRVESIGPTHGALQHDQGEQSYRDFHALSLRPDDLFVELAKHDEGAAAGPKALDWDRKGSAGQVIGEQRGWERGGGSGKRIFEWLHEGGVGWGARGATRARGATGRLCSRVRPARVSLANAGIASRFGWVGVP